jgi:sugar-specific transcriptional regulator TrmB
MDAETESANIQNLVGLGLTHSQAIVYSSLLSLGKSTGRDLWAHSSVARQHIYQILAELERIGLVERVLGKPTHFKAVPVQHGISILVEREVEECRRKQKMAKELVEMLSSARPAKLERDEFTVMQTRPWGKENRGRVLHIAPEYELCCISSVNRFFKLDPDIFSKIQESLRRGATVRLITEKTDNKHFLKSLISLKNEKFEYRHITEKPENSLTIFDGKQLIVDIDESKLASVPVMITSHPLFVRAFQDYFEARWREALKAV